MSIDGDLQVRASITEGDRALTLFTDRYSFTRLLAERINDPPAKEILFFHGAGGNGKSLLLKYLQQTVCKRLTAAQWQQVKGKPDDELQAALKNWPATQYMKVPSALLDFAPRLGRQNTDPFYGLVRIREALSASMKGTHYKLRFPLHTYGCFLYLQKTNRLGEVDDLFRFEEVALVKDFVGLFQSIPAGVGLGLSVLTLVNKYSGDRLTHYRRRFGLSEQLVEQLQSMDAEKALLPVLPVLLAQDLRAAMAEQSESTPDRVVLFFDTHEAFYGEDRNRWTNFFRDGWLRRLLRELIETPEIIVVVAGRDRPQWAAADEYELNTEIAEDCFCAISVDSLAVSDADIFLQRAGIADEGMRDRLIRYASEGENAVHPLHLGLCTDVVIAAERSEQALTPGDFSEVPAFKKKSQYLIRQLLKYVDDELEYAVRALSACRSFDFAVYRLLGKALDFAVSRPVFERLVSFSFVRQIDRTEAQSGQGQYRIHDLLRRLSDSAETAAAHEVLRAHYEASDEIEAIYHVNQLDWSAGVNRWVGTFGQALELSQYEVCRTLLDLRRELKIEMPFMLGLVSDAEGQYFQNLALHATAQKAYGEAIAAYDEDLKCNPESVATLNNKGLSLQRLADLQAALSQHQRAEQSYADSIAAYDAALYHAPDYVIALNNKGLSLKGLADLQTALSQHQQAKASYGEAIAAYDAALSRAPDDVEVLNNKGLSLQGLADLQTALSQQQQAEQSYASSIAIYDAALYRSPDYVIALNNKGLSLQGLANLQAILFQHQRAKQSYADAIAAYDDALYRAPDFVQALNNKGNSLQGLAGLQADLSQYQQAEQSYTDSIAAYDAALYHAPDYVGALNNKGGSLQRLADLQADLFQHQQAEQNYVGSVTMYNAALYYAPDLVEALNNKGLSLKKLADLQ